MADNKPSSGNSKRYTPIILLLAAGLPVLLATLMYFNNAFVPQGRTNKGQLIVPPLSLNKLDVSIQQAGEGTLSGKWQLIVFGAGDCRSEACQARLHTLRQVNVALGREAGRVARQYISRDLLSVQEMAKLQAEYPRLHVGRVSQQSLRRFLDGELDADSVMQAHVVFIADPLGNVMMYYMPAHDGNDILDDLKRLLKVSNIG